mgnify:CR=1 FL=1
MKKHSESHPLNQVKEAMVDYGAAMTEQDMRVAACIKWYELGRLSKAGAAKLANLSQVEFQEVLREYDLQSVPGTSGNPAGSHRPVQPLPGVVARISEEEAAAPPSPADVPGWS